jgi:hypothetical protein
MKQEMSSLSRRTLARVALRLNARSGYAGLLPALVLMTDEKRLPDPLAAARALPKGSAVVVRHSKPNPRAKLAHALAGIARERGLILLVAGDAKLADAAHADGLHLPEARVAEASYWRTRRPQWLITVAAHSAPLFPSMHWAASPPPMLGASPMRAPPASLPWQRFKLKKSQELLATLHLIISAAPDLASAVRGRLAEARLSL